MASPSNPQRMNREFRIMFRPLSTLSGDETKKQKRQKITRMFENSSFSFLNEFSAVLGEKASHWALVVLEPSEYSPNSKAKTPLVGSEDPRIQRVFELRKKGSGGSKSGSDSKDGPYEELKPPEDSDQEDRHEDDEGVPEANKEGLRLTMQVSERPRDGFSELKFEHIGGVCWEILTGIEARTKYSNSEIRHEAQRIWKRQQDYHLLTNNCQRFCVLLAITIRARNHSLLRVLHGSIVKKQMKEHTLRQVVGKA